MNLKGCGPLSERCSLGNKTSVELTKIARTNVGILFSGQFHNCQNFSYFAID